METSRVNNSGYSLIELLVAIGIIMILATIAAVSLFATRGRATDTVRKTDLNQIGRLLWASACYVPTSGAGDYDMQDIVDEFVAANPSAAQYVSQVPRDPKVGTETATGYRYIYDASGACAVYANLVNPEEEVTLPGLNAPTAGGGTGVLQGAATGVNGTNRYYQVAR